jgi:hypothetical protein
VWNEPNAATFWNPSPDPAAYTQLLQAAYPAIKAADPNGTVIGGVVGWVTDYPGLAISPAKYVQGMYDAGAQGISTPCRIIPTSTKCRSAKVDPTAPLHRSTNST